jgi:hypothetical protein
VVVKIIYRYSDIILLQPLISSPLFSEHIYGNGIQGIGVALPCWGKMRAGARRTNRIDAAVWQDRVQKMEKAGDGDADEKGADHR